MSKAEERAKAAYPAWRNGEFSDFNQNSAYYGFIDGYHQAEKDLEFSWEDLREITDLCDKLTLEKWHEEEKFTSEEGFYKEVLKRFLETKALTNK